jgi:signal-transduction protein with cAMP-binding, CBS, and nucleotidyltransferase domain
MTAQPEWISPRETAAAAAERFAATGVSALPVCDEAGTPVGILTDRDLVVRLLAQGGDPCEVPVGELAESPAVTADAGQPLIETARQLVRHRLRRMPVVQGGRLVGMVSRGDVAAYLQPDDVSALLEEVSRSGLSDRRGGAWTFRTPYGRRRESSAHREAQRRRVAEEARLGGVIRELAAEDRRARPS